MAHAINFSVDPKLLDAFNASESLNRALKVQIADEAFVLRKELPTMQGAGEQTEFGRMKGDFIVAAEACFVFYRDASQTWNMFSFVPDDAPVRDKMLYSRRVQCCSRHWAALNASRRANNGRSSTR